MGLERIQKVIARAGVASRREAEQMILEGRVTVNGKVVEQLGFKVDPLKDHIKVDGKRLPAPEPKVTFLLYKPKGYLSTVRDPVGRPTVMDLMKGVRWRVYPLGRLDFDAEGVLLMTNDGELFYRLSHPRFSIPRTYWAKVEGIPKERDLIRLRRGLHLEDGPAKALSVRVLRKTEKHCWIESVVTEGRNHLIKRMFLAIGHPVLKLKRVAFGPIQLGDLSPGQYRLLTSEELGRLRRAIGEGKRRAGG
ncbi:MAG: rRNA pseudouridine synthase [Desulfobacterota bacterium]|nr:rRNA pseudouridine synthase [Thermodesulfobacteriota bacterium]